MKKDRDRDRDRDKTKPGEVLKKQKRRFCYFCKEHIDYIDYKDLSVLKKFISDKNKIKARRITGACSQHQRDLAIAIKRAREVALVPYSFK